MHWTGYCCVKSLLFLCRQSFPEGCLRAAAEDADPHSDAGDFEGADILQAGAAVAASAARRSRGS